MPDKPLVYHDFVLELTDLQADGAFKVRVSGETPSGRKERPMLSWSGRASASVT